MENRIKTLLVEYTPRHEKSRTRQLREYFTNLITDHTDLEFLDLCKEKPDFFDHDNLRAYYKRNYDGQELTTDEAKLLEKMDRMRDQLLNNDVLILSSPMYNFGYPAVVKAWIDSVMQRGYVYNVDKNGHNPRLQHLKVCQIYTAGITYDQIGENENWNGLIPTGAKLFEYMGASDVRTIHIEGIDMLDQKYIDFRRNTIAKQKLNGLAKFWYGLDIPESEYTY